MNSPLKVQYGCGLCNSLRWKKFDATPSLFIRKIPFLFLRFLLAF